MCLFTWTQIQTGQINPEGRVSCSLSAISDGKLVLHGGVVHLQGGRVIVLHNGIPSDMSLCRDTWIFDIQSQTWKKHASAVNYHVGHTGTATMNSTVIIVGGTDDLGNSDDSCTVTFHIRLEPKSLQQLAVKTIYNHRTELCWECLPKKLITLLGISKNCEKTQSKLKTLML